VLRVCSECWDGVVSDITFQALLGVGGELPRAQLLMEELDDGVSQALGVCHCADGGLNLSELEWKETIEEEEKTVLLLLLLLLLL